MKSRSNQAHAQLASVMAGRLHLRDASPAVQSWARLPIDMKARRIIALPTREERRRATDALPETIRDAVRDRVIELWGKKYKKNV